MNLMNVRRLHSLRIVALACAALLSGCAVNAESPQNEKAIACDAGNPMAETTLYFGLSRPHGPDITLGEWQKFVDQEVTPRFRNGLTVFKAQGQWLGNDGKVAKEGSRALMLIHPLHDETSNKSIEELRSIYKKTFAQESVMRIETTKCVSF
ncbi:hypothetical protein VA7868_03441 [Vibrio aerogenes CECT 7868]|uniref:DUF3574 domain-containing protein n=1 Tax=Vibrio aerogenes CECT 7868 TaxID=1216006 RepID=A0A1M6A1F8_9VIBR|nr:DUF3574 domain-containing protein [Vibrio aerogenes]SHI30344.1 hypothetical protein VA7868_03441 [Vibrio aerogenes CECT 7868]